MKLRVQAKWQLGFFLAWIGGAGGGCGPAVPYVPLSGLPANPPPQARVPERPSADVEVSPSWVVPERAVPTVELLQAPLVPLPLAQQLRMRIGKGWPGRLGFIDPGADSPLQSSQGAVVQLKTTLLPTDTLIWSDLVPDSPQPIRAAHFVFQVFDLKTQKIEVGHPIPVWRDVVLGIEYIPVSELLLLLQKDQLVLSSACLYHLKISMDWGVGETRVLELFLRIQE